MQSAASQRGYALGSTIGMRIAADFQEMQIDVDPDAVAKGVRDALAGESKMTEEQIAEVMMNLQQEAEQKDGRSNSKQQAQQAGTQNQQWLEQNAAGEGWQTTESGLQYKVVEEGEGESPTETDRVKVHYTGTLTDGTKFDSSRDRGQPRGVRRGAGDPRLDRGAQDDEARRPDTSSPSPPTSVTACGARPRARSPPTPSSSSMSNCLRSTPTAGCESGK